jgi:hypothetical protein
MLLTLYIFLELHILCCVIDNIFHIILENVLSFFLCVFRILGLGLMSIALMVIDY